MPHLDKEKIKSIFNDDWCGMIKFFNLLLSPLFKTFEKGYDDFSDVEVQQKCKILDPSCWMMAIS